MYIVEIQNDNKIIEIHGEKQKLKSGNVVKGINSIDSFSFVILPNNAGFSQIRDYKTLVRVYNTNRKRYEFFGRVLYSSDEMSASGNITKAVTCESYLGFLYDSRQRYVTERNWTVRGLLEYIVEVHNSKVEEYKRFSIGEVTVTDQNDNLYLGIQRESTWKTIEEKLLNKLGGEIRFRVVDGVNYLDYLTEIGETKATAIELSKNMKAITKENDPSEYITRLIPLGCKLKDSDGNETEERLDITSVNNGYEYIDSASAREAYGIKEEYVEWDDVTDAANLLQKGIKYLAENNRVKVKYSITALDLSLLGLVLDDFDVCNRHPIKNKLLGIDDIARIIKKNIDVCEEVKSTIEVGDNFKTLLDIQNEREKQFETVGSDIKKLQNIADVLGTKVSETTTTVKDLEDKLNNGMDYTQDFEEIRETIQTNHTNAISHADKILLEALTEYVSTGEFGTFKETIETQFQQSAEDFSFNFTQLQEHIKNVEGVMQSQYAETLKYIRFVDGNIILGEENNPLVLRIAKEKIVFEQNGIEVAYFSNAKMYVTDIEATNSLTVAGLKVTRRTNGSIDINLMT